MIKSIVIRKALCVLAAAGALVGIGAALASVSNVAGAVSVDPVSDSVRDLVSDSAAADEPPSPNLGKSSKGVHIHNNSLGKMVLVADGGDNAGLQPLGETLSPGTGYHDFEVVFRAAKKTTDYADYDIYDMNNNKIGTSTINMTVDAFGDTSVKSTFTALDGTTPLPLKTADFSDGFQVVSTTNTTTNIDASNPTAKTLVEQYCNNTDTAYMCTFTPGYRSPGTRMSLLAVGYNQPGGGNTSSTLSVQSGYKASTTDSWSDSVSAELGLEGVFSVGIEATYGESVSFENTFTASAQIPVNAGDTGYIWGKVPVIAFAGAMQLKLGNTTYNIQNASLETPDASHGLSDFQVGTWPGNDPLNSPDTPPAGAKALN